MYMCIHLHIYIYMYIHPTHSNGITHSQAPQVSDLLPNEGNAEWLTAGRYTLYDKVLRLRAQILAQGDEIQARCQRTVLSINKHREAPYNKANPLVQRSCTTPYG